MKVNPIIGVKDVVASAKWYQSVFGCKGMHGGDEFEVLVADDESVFLCLHKWGAHEHPTLKDPSLIIGNGLILYFQTKHIEEIRSRLQEMNYKLESELAKNPNSHKMEFSLIDPDGYYLSISEDHNFGA